MHMPFVSSGAAGKQAPMLETKGIVATDTLNTTAATGAHQQAIKKLVEYPPTMARLTDSAFASSRTERFGSHRILYCLYDKYE
jgi:hypothetical protein